MKRLLVALCATATGAVPLTGFAATHYVRGQSGTEMAGNGSEAQPFATLEAVERNSQPGDTIVVLPSRHVLDGGIQLKDGQTLEGGGPDVRRAPAHVAHAKISNSSNARLGGDAVRLANDNTVRNIHVTGTWRAGIMGINAAAPAIVGNLISNNMLQHDLQTLQRDFVLFELQRNHYAGITLFNCGTATPNECQDEAADIPGLASDDVPVTATIVDNEVRDSNVEAIVILTDAGVTAEYTVRDNYVHHLSMAFDGFSRDDLEAPLEPEVVRSRAFTMISGNGSDVALRMDAFDASYLAPMGDFASDGVVLVAFGDGARVSAEINDVIVTNPDHTGEIVNGDSLELSHFGDNATFDVTVNRAQFSDSVSTLVKLLEIGPVNGNTTRFEIVDSALTNDNPRGRSDGAQGAITYIKIPATGADQVNTVDVKVRNTVFTGHMRGIHLLNLHEVHVGTFNLMLEDSVMTGLAHESVRLFNQEGQIDSSTIDLGGGPLGSNGGNVFTDNGTTTDDAEIAIVNLKFDGSPIAVHASGNYWGGGEAEVGESGDLTAAGPVEFTVGDTLEEDPRM